MPWKDLLDHYDRAMTDRNDRSKQEGTIPIMAIRPLIFGILFIAVFVGIILSIIWVDTSHPIHQPDPLSPTAPGPATPGTVQ
uniref:hypothetical protein n=1 Tax=Rhizobium sp. F40D2 TaxID=3453141 RepID=UPI003F2888C6